jgi:UDP:flavonoid glycosyltransferase YjiC (YdhE family)
MITHAGPNSIKECIYFGVPMILFPLFFDQEGNAARAVYHGLGVRGSFKEITSEGLQKLIAEVFYNESYKNNINRMRSLFEKKERAKLSIKLIEDLLISN